MCDLLEIEEFIEGTLRVCREIRAKTVKLKGMFLIMLLKALLRVHGLDKPSFCSLINLGPVRCQVVGTCAQELYAFMSLNLLEIIAHQLFQTYAVPKKDL